MSELEQKQRRIRAVAIYSLTSVTLVGVSIFLLWALRELILPTLVGALAAYLCRPLVTEMKRRGLSHGLSILFLFVIFFLAIVGLTKQVQSLIPDDKGKLELRVRVQYKLDKKYDEMMGLNEIHQGKKGNVFYQLFGKEIDPSFNKLINLIMLGPHERILFEYYAHDLEEGDPIDDKYYDYYLENIKNDQQRLGKNYLRQPTQEEQEQEDAGKEKTSVLETIGNVISLWLAAPFVFLFLLLDEGQIKKSLVLPVPNRYFEVILTIIDNVDEAIGNYLRGTLLECTMVGLTFFFCLFVVGFELQVALMIGAVAGLANAIPFLGPAIGLVIGVGFSLITEEITPLMPWVTLDNLTLFVLGTVVIAQALDNAVFQPIILGSAVSLHPLVVIIGVMGGSILLGFAGMLFAIPAIVVVKVIFTTFFQEMKAYHII